MVISFGPRLLAATAVLIIGSLAIKVIVRGLSKILSKSKLDKNLNPFPDRSGRLTVKGVTGSQCFRHDRY